MDKINYIIDKSNKDVESRFDYENFIIRGLSDVIHNDEDTGNMEYIIKTNKIPLLYFFDKYLNKNINITIEHRDIFLDSHVDNIYGSFKLNKHRIINIKIDNHAIILYPFIYNQRNYVYLSNSGLGINNQNTTENKTSCKLFHIIKQDSIDIIHTMFLLIEEILELIQSVYPFEYLNSSSLISIENKKKLYENIDKIWNNIYTNFVNGIIEKNPINEEFLSLFFTNILRNMQNNSHNIGYIDLIYIILNYLAQAEFMNECTFHHVLTGNDHSKYIELIHRLIYNEHGKFTFNELYLNCMNGYNEKVYLSIREELDVKMPPITNDFINDINQKLDEYAKLKKTIEFKRDSIVMELHNSGLYNYVQVGGSCVFYCFYNLLINNLFLTNYQLYQTDKEKAVDNVISPLIYIHYILLRHLCMCNDTQLLNSNEHFFPNQIFHMSYIYNIMIENNLEEEITEFYSSPDLMIFSKTPLIDRLLDFTLYNNVFNIKEDIRYYTRFEVIEFKKYFNKMDLLINNYLNNIRNLRDLSVKSLILFRNDLYAIYNRINILFERKDFYTDCIKYLNISKDIIIVYCYYLRRMYSKEVFFTKYIKKNNQIRVLYPVASYPSYVSTANCGASEDCTRKKCTPQVYNCFYTYNIDYILNKFNSYEINAISTLLKNYFDVDIKTKITKLFKLSECNNLKVGSIDITLYDFYNNNIYLESDNSNKNLKIFLKGLISKYFRNKYISINSYLPEEQRKIHTSKCDYIIEKLKENIKSIADCSSLFAFKTTIYDVIDYLNEFYFKTAIQILLFVLSNSEYLFLSKGTCTDNTFFNMMSIINENTEIMYSENDDEFIIEKIYYFLVQNTKFDIINNTIERHSEWISKYDIIFNGRFFKYNRENYVYNLKILYRNSISIILARFGIHEQNSDEYILLIPDYFLERDDDDNSFLLQSFATFTFFICIKKTKTIIEININEDKVDKNNCYLLKNEKRHKLIFDIQYPFLSFFTETTPYLCYTYDNTTYLDIIVSSAFWSITAVMNYQYLLYKNLDTNENHYQFNILEFEVAYSMTFPTTKTNNIQYIENIHRLYPSSRILQFSNEQLIKKDVSIDYTYIDVLTTVVKDIATMLCKNINCDEKTNEIFKQVFVAELSETESRNNVLESFLKENRLCIRFDFNNEIMSPILDGIYEKLKEITDTLRIEHNFNKPSFIIDNLSYIITIMEINLLLNELSKINMKTTCWDIQLLLTKLDSILYFNEEIKLRTYHLYELLFLFQNNYFFKENQITKYRNILNDMITNNSSLTIHQFMMGKGKTSFLTPLLSMAIYLFTGKSSIVITPEHLIYQTTIFMRYIHYLGNVPISVVTDYDYKHFWLDKTDINLLTIQHKEQQYQLNINNTSLIIDEFNSHYDYTQSMFNLVKKQEYISEEMFNYIFDYIHSKISSEDFVPIVIPELKNQSVFNQILDKEFNIAKKLKYNEKYGFNNIEGDIRLCIPYARKDTPLMGSRFSSIILTIILTLNYYINIQNYKLNEKYDYPLIVRNYNNFIKFLPSDMFDEWYKYIQKNKKIDIDIIHSTFEKLYSNLEVYVPLLKKYLYVINKSALVFATEQYNVSFQDIIFNVYPEQWKVGYTGTVYLNPDIYFKDDTFVFKNKIEDFDERIEVKLALNGYGSSSNWDNNVVIINSDHQKTLLKQLQIILSVGINRGIVDIDGLFIDYKNINIAKDLQSLLPGKKIVYLSDTHLGLEYSENENEKYKPFHDDNFYYYDQCHIIGTDLEQPNQGYIAVIINKKTKWTEFSQGIFRFRKLNRGTYLKVFYITNGEEKLEKGLTNDNILELLEKNETLFEKGQELGIKFQLMKTMVRKLSKNYLEDSLINEFLLSDPITIQDCVAFLIQNIKHINLVLKNEDNPYLTYINGLYNDIVSNKDFISLVIGSQSTQKQIDMEIMENKDVQKLSFSLMNYDHNITYQYDVITHLGCLQCIRTTSVPLFLNDFNCMINGKPIYISINIALGFNSSSQIDTTLLIFVELPEIILLEIEYIAYDYYSHKVPIYDFNGNLLNIFLKNSALLNPFKLDIDYRFLYLFSITNYINHINEKNQYTITKSVIDEMEHNLNIEAVKIFFFLNTNLPDDYKNLFDTTPIILYLVKKHIPGDIIRLINIPQKDNNQEHNPENRLDNMFFDRFNNTILRIPFQIIYDKYYYRLDSKPSN